MQVYIVIANKEERVKECVVLSNWSEAKQIFEHLKSIWGDANVALVGRLVDEIPFIIANQLTDRSNELDNYRGCVGCKHTQLFCSACLEIIRSQT